MFGIGNLLVVVFLGWLLGIFFRLSIRVNYCHCSTTCSICFFKFNY